MRKLMRLVYFMMTCLRLLGLEKMLMIFLKIQSYLLVMRLRRMYFNLCEQGDAANLVFISELDIYL